MHVATAINQLCHPPKPDADGLTRMSGGSAILSSLANAYYGLAPWNAFYKDTYFDELLLPGIARPSDVMLVSKQHV